MLSAALSGHVKDHHTLKICTDSRTVSRWVQEVRDLGTRATPRRCLHVKAGYVLGDVRSHPCIAFVLVAFFCSRGRGVCGRPVQRCMLQCTPPFFSRIWDVRQVAQLNQSYRDIFEDMQGFARLTLRPHEASSRAPNRQLSRAPVRWCCVSVVF